MAMILQADLDNARHAAGLLACLDAYASDPMGGGVPLPADVKARVVAGLRQNPANVNFLAVAGEQIVGAAVCFMGYSTFRGRPRFNVHDLCVLPTERQKGIGRQLLQAAADYAQSADCCAVTLEVREDNAPAQRLYRSLGFADLAAPMRFWEKTL